MKRTLLILILIFSTISAFALTKWFLNKEAEPRPEKKISQPSKALLISDRVKVMSAAPGSAEESAVAVLEESVEEEPVVADPVVEEKPAAEETAVAAAEDTVEEEPVVADPVVEEKAAAEETAFAVAEDAVEEEPIVADPVVEEKAAAEETAFAVAEDAVEEEPVVAGPVVEERPAAEETAVAAAEDTAGEVPLVPETAIAGDAAVIDDGREKIILLPFDNFTKEASVINRIMPEIKLRLSERGLYVINEELVTDFLCDRRIRPAGYVSQKIAKELGEHLNASTIMAGSVVSFSSSGIPKIGVLARLIDSKTGAILWADYISASGEDYSVLFGMGTIKKAERLMPKAMDKLFTTFSTDRPQKKAGNVQKIAVMPFKNESDTPNAGKIVTYMFLVELLKNPRFEPIEYGEIRKLCVELRIRNRGGLEFRNIEALSEALGTYGILLGSVDKYSFGANRSSIPEISVTARLLDARKNKIMWYNSLQLSGEEDTVAFDWGRVKHVDKLAYKAVSGLVESMGKSQRY